MAWSSLPEPVRQEAERVLTRKQLDMLKLYANGYGYGRIALILGVSEPYARRTVTRALQKMKPYMEEVAQ